MPPEDLTARRDAGLLLDMVMAAEDLIGEAAGKVSEPGQAARPEVPWREIVGMRHRLVQGYADVDLDLVWMVVRERLPKLVGALRP